MPPYSAPPPPPRGAPARPYLSTLPESSYRLPTIQGSFGGYSGHQDSSSSYFSVMPESFYRLPTIQDIPRKPLGTHVYVSTPVGDFVVVDWIYQSRVVTFCGYETRADLLLLDKIDFKVILGMDWLSSYHAIIDCHAKTVTLAMPKLSRLEWKGYYRRFVKGFSSIAAPLTRLTHKGAPFRWSNECEASFQKLKTVLTTTPVLVMPSGSGMYTVYCDASRVGLGCVLM
uniref:Reverse transcriptase/retrotransposon-derived protein RNase H-like domain-containing protein n=1 Tax=Nicotiana tabacum TaxID=4097 RepID=A0A1S4CHB8_TOBAC|nr:PREDICTED: uncharacterized protein LOC107819029 [Nicotiana tabacum]